MKITRTISKVLFGGGGILLLGFTFVGQAAAQSLYVVDRVKAAVLKFDGATGAPLGIFTSGDVGDDPDPYSLACGPNGNLFVSFFSSGAVSSGTVKKFDATGASLGTFASIKGPRGLTFGPNGNLFVASPSEEFVREFDGTGGLVQTFSDPSLTSPHGVTIGPNGNLFVSDLVNQQVVEFDSGTGALIGDFTPFGLGGHFELKFGPDSGPCGPLVTDDDDDDDDHGVTVITVGGDDDDDDDDD